MSSGHITYMAEGSGSSSEGVRVELIGNDTPGAILAAPIEDRTVPALKWWLLCRRIKVPKFIGVTLALPTWNLNPSTV